MRLTNINIEKERLNTTIPTMTKPIVESTVMDAKSKNAEAPPVVMAELKMEAPMASTASFARSRLVFARARMYAWAT